MNDLINSLNNINAFILSFSNVIVAYSGLLSSLVSRLSNFAIVSSDYFYFAVQFIPPVIWSVFLFEFVFGAVKFLKGELKDVKDIIVWW
jgi:integral membrane sensor domain MASE1